MSNRLFTRPASSSPHAVKKINQVIPDQSAPALELAFSFAQQSLIQPFGSSITDFSYSILPQPVNQPIVPSTKSTKQLSGYALALAPDSQCPVAVVFRAGGQPINSNPVVIMPGQIIRPHGVPRKYDAHEPASFSAFDFGLPFGWLGGGIGRVLVFRTEDSLLRYIPNGTTDRLFHTESFKILAADATTIKPNWPKNFPWVSAKSQLDSTGAVVTNVTAQGGPGTIAVRPSYVILELTCNAAGLANAANVDVYMHYTAPGQTTANAVPVYDQITFPTCPNGSNSYLIVNSSSSAGGILNAFADGYAFVNFVSGDATIQGYTINAYRYGLIG